MSLGGGFSVDADQAFLRNECILSLKQYYVLSVSVRFVFFPEIIIRVSWGLPDKVIYYENIIITYI